jgi:hypothetical protein
VASKNIIIIIIIIIVNYGAPLNAQDFQRDGNLRT